MLIHSTIKRGSRVLPNESYARNGVMISYNEHYAVESNTALPEGIYRAVESPDGDKFVLVNEDLGEFNKLEITKEACKYKVSEDFFDKLFRLTGFTHTNLPRHPYSDFIHIDHQAACLVATDGFKLKCIRHNLPFLPSGRLDIGINVPIHLAKQLELIKKKNKGITMQGDVIYALAGNTLTYIFQFGSFKIYSLIPSGFRFPKYEIILNALANEYKKHYIVDKKEMLEIIKKIKKETTNEWEKKIEQVDINFEKGIMFVERDNQDSVVYTLNITPVSYAKDDDETTILMPIRNDKKNNDISLDIKYLEKILESFPRNKKQLNISFISNTKALIFK